MGRAIVVGLLAVSAALPTTAEAQDRSEFQLWAALLATAHTATEPPGLSFWLDTHARRGENGTVVILRPGIGAELTKNISVWAGYAWVPVFDDATGNTTNEHRIWQQLVLKHSVGGFSFQSRTRLEQRFSEAGDDVGARIRQFVRVNWRPSSQEPFGLAFWDEIFIGLNEPDWGAPQGFDQNRIFIGPFLQVASWARLEAGYLFVYLDRSPNVRAHVLAINLFVSPRF
ncbi:MAG: DUF2490 domain-containing protein [Myxococcota bacterium]